MDDASGKMRLILVNPPAPTVDIRAPQVASVAGMMPPMGLLALAAYVRHHALAEVRLLDLQGHPDPGAAVREAVAGFQPHAAGITACLFTFPGAMLAARAVRAADPCVRIILGGHHVSVFPAETAGLDFVDAAVFGEGERTLEELLGALARGDNPAGMSGVAARDPQGRVTVGPPRPLIPDLDTLPHMDRSMLHTKDYKWVLDRDRRATLLFAGRGCPFHCAFCFNVMRESRFHSAEYVVEEMRRCAAQGYTMLSFYDETFNIGRARTLALARAIRDADLGVAWSFRGRCDVMDDALARELADAGCARINFGIEAGTDEILKVYRKQITVDMVRQAVRAAARAGIEPVGYFILGAPHETLDQCRAPIRLATSLPLDAAQFMTLIPLPGTEIYDRALAEKGFETDYLRAWAANPQKPLSLRVWTTAIDEDALARLMRQAYRTFYLRPRFIGMQLAKLRSWDAFKTRVSAALSIIRFSLFKKP